MIAYTRFINTMKQEPVIEQLLPLSGERLGAPETVWDYIYEPEARGVLDQVMTRYIEALIYQAVAENMASEQSARMVAMKAASDNAGDADRRADADLQQEPAGGDHQGALGDRRRRRRRVAGPTSGKLMAQTARHHRPVHRRGHRHRVPRDGDAQDLRRADPRGRSDQPAGREGPDLRGRAAARRRRGALHRAGLLRRPAPRHEGEGDRRADLGAGRQGHARAHHGRARPPDRRAAARSSPTSAARSTRSRRSSTSSRLRWSCSRPASR